MIERVIQAGKCNLQKLLCVVFVDIKSPITSTLFSVIHQFTDDIAGITKRNFVIRHADAGVIFYTASVISEFESVIWHRRLPTTIGIMSGSRHGKQLKSGSCS